MSQNLASATHSKNSKEYFQDDGWETVKKKINIVITFFIGGALRVGKSIKVAGGGHRTAEIRQLTTGVKSMLTKFLCWSFLFG